MLVRVVTTHLEVTRPDQGVLRSCPREGGRIARVSPPIPELNRFFYTAVGGDWKWIDRLPWTYHQWEQAIAEPDAETWVLTVDGVPAGYYETQWKPETGVEIAYFGLLPQFVGNGWGGWLLSHALEQGWRRVLDAGPRFTQRVWLHTCSLDHPMALANYLKRGFKVFRVDEEWKEIPEQPSGPWPGSVRGL